MHEVLIAVRSCHESSRCEPNKRGVSPEVGVAPKNSRRNSAANFLLETPLFKVWLRPCIIVSQEYIIKLLFHYDMYQM